MRLDCVARLCLVRCRIPQLIPSHRMARHARTLQLQQQAAILSSATASSSSSSGSSSFLHMAEQLSIEESLSTARNQPMIDVDLAATFPTTLSIAAPQSAPAAVVDPQSLSRSLSVVIPASAHSPPSSLHLFQAPSSPVPTAVVLPSSLGLSHASSGAGLPEPMSLSRASSPSLSVASDCPDSTLPSDEPAQLQPVSRCPSPTMSSFYLFPPLPPASTANGSCPELSLNDGQSEELQLPSPSTAVHLASPAASLSRPPSARSQRVAQRMAMYREKERQSPSAAFSSLPSSGSSSPIASSSQLPQPSLVVPKPRRLLVSHPYAAVSPHILASRHQRHPYQQSDLQLIHQQQQQQQLLAQHYMAALQQSALPRYLPAATPILVSPSNSFPATFHYSFPTPPPSSLSPYLISTLPDSQPVRVPLGAVVRV